MPFLEVSGCNYHFEIAGSGEPMIMLHGILQSGAEFRRAGWVDALGSVRTLILVDLPGHGLSASPDGCEAYRVESIARAIVEIARVPGHDRFDYPGFSLGGRVGFELAARSPSALRKLIIAAQHARPRLVGASPGYRA